MKTHLSYYVNNRIILKLYIIQGAPYMWKRSDIGYCDYPWLTNLLLLWSISNSDKK